MELIGIFILVLPFVVGYIIGKQEEKYKKELPKRDGTSINFNLTPQQCAWLKARKEEGVPCFAVLGVGNLLVCTQDFDNVNSITKSQFMRDAINISEFVAKLENLCVK